MEHPEAERHRQMHEISEEASWGPLQPFGCNFSIFLSGDTSHCSVKFSHPDFGLADELFFRNEDKAVVKRWFQRDALLISCLLPLWMTCLVLSTFSGNSFGFLCTVEFVLLLGV